MLNGGCLTEILQVNCIGGFAAVIKDGLENVIFLWRSRISEAKKHVVLLISQKDYVHIYKSIRFGIRNNNWGIWNWLNVSCLR